MPSHLKDSDPDLWAKFLNGDEQVLSLIYLGHVNALFDYGCKLTSDKDLVKDCIQDIFCTIIKNRESLSGTDNIRLYLFKALKRKVVRELQKSAKLQDIDSEAVVGFEISFLHSFDHVEVELTERQKQELVAAVDSLTARQKEAIYLRFTRGLDYKAIAMILSLNHQSARALIHRAIVKLRDILSGKPGVFNQVLFLFFRQNAKTVF